MKDGACVRTAVVALGDVEIVGQGPYDVESASPLAEEIRGQLGSQREAWPAIENVQDRGGVAPVEHDFDWSRGVAHDVTEQLAEYELGRVQAVRGQPAVT
jgi:hypothetical protein